MKYLIIGIALALSIDSVYSQQTIAYPTSLVLSGGRVAFGTGDILGYSVAIDLSTNLNKKARAGLAQLLLGAELIFESGSKSPYANGNAASQIPVGSFGQVCNTVLWNQNILLPASNDLAGLACSSRTDRRLFAPFT